MLNQSLDRALNVIGDNWAWLIIKEAFLGTVRFQDFQKNLNIPRQTLINRLQQMTEAALFYKAPVYNRRLLFEYRLTAKGLDLYQVSLCIWRFHRDWHPNPSILPEELMHKTCGQSFLPEFVCTSCHVTPTIGSMEFMQRHQERAIKAPVSTRRRSRIANAVESLGEVYFVTVVLGDAWNVLLLDAAARNIFRFHDLVVHLGISSNVLTTRLKPLVKLGLLEQTIDEDDKRVKKYSMTDKGKETYPIILSLTAWGDRWLMGNEGPSEVFVHQPCNTYASYQVRCNFCAQPLHVNDVVAGSLKAAEP